MSAARMPLADDDDTAAYLLERRWFAASAAVSRMQSECDLLRDTMTLAEDAWRRAQTRLAELEILRDAMGRQLYDLIGTRESAPIPTPPRVQLSAA